MITVGAVLAGRDNNVIPASAEPRLNLRWFDRSARELLLKRIDAIDHSIAVGAGMPADKMPKTVMKGTADPPSNDAALTATINPPLVTLLGAGKLIDTFPSVMGSEDFQEAFAKTGTPYSFLLIGIAPLDRWAASQRAGQQFPFANHNNDFVVDLAAIPLGTRINTVAALALLAK